MSYTAFLPTMPLEEPLIVTMAGLLETNLPAVVSTANAAITDGYPVPTPAQYLDFLPLPAELEGGMPIIAVGESAQPGEFMDDLQSTVDSEWTYLIRTIIQSGDHETLAKNLRRLTACVVYTVQQDRLQNQLSVMRNAGGAFSVNFHRIVPGPMLGEPSPLDPNVYTAWLSWTDFIVSSRHNEQRN